MTQLQSIGQDISGCRKRFITIDSLRGLAFLVIFFHHCYFKDACAVFSHGGSIGVTLFYLISGFVLCEAFGESLSSGRLTYGRFILGRFVKIWPLQLACCAFVIIFQRENYGEGFFYRMLPQIFMCQSWVPDEAVYFTGNVPSWFLSGLMLFYVLFPVMWRWLERNATQAILTIGLLWGAVVVAALLMGNANIWKIQYFFYVFPPVRAVECFTGMVLWHFVRQQYCRRLSDGAPGGVARDLLWILLAAAFVALCEFWGMFPKTFDDTFMGWVVCAGAVVLATLPRRSQSLIDRMLDSRPLLRLGGVSFAAYLIHTIVQQYTDYEMKKIGLGEYYLTGCIIALVVSVIGAAILMRWYVWPLSRLLRRV